MKREVRGKVVNLKDIIAGRAAAEELQKTVATREDLAGFHPAHAACVYAQNQVSVMAEQLTALDEMAPFADIRLQGRGPLHAQWAADKPAYDILLHMLGVLRRWRRAGQRNHRHDRLGG